MKKPLKLLSESIRECLLDHTNKHLGELKIIISNNKIKIYCEVDKYDRVDKASKECYILEILKLKYTVIGLFIV